MLRTIGEDAKFGSVYSINPLMIIFLVPFIQAYASMYKLFRNIYFSLTLLIIILRGYKFFYNDI